VENRSLTDSLAIDPQRLFMRVIPSDHLLFGSGLWIPYRMPSESQLANSRSRVVGNTRTLYCGLHQKRKMGTAFIKETHGAQGAMHLNIK
jgi:hypothetical protein